MELIGKNNNNFSITDLFILLILITSFKILFYFTGFILEDSFIVFRSAFNLAEYGKFSYNLDELNSATTSKIFGLICAILKLIFNEYAILSIIAFNSIISFFSSLFIFLSIKNLIGKNISLSKEVIYFLTVLIFLNPSISIIGIVGLEFSILVFFMSLVFLAISKNSKILLIFSAFIPLIRIELVGFILIVSFSYLYFLKFKQFFIVILSGFIGVLLNGYLNLVYDGLFFPGPAVSKWNTLGDTSTFSLNRILEDLDYWLFASRSFFLGVYSKFIPNSVYFFTAIAILLLATYNFKFLLFKRFKEIDLKYKIYLISISASVIFLPLSYIIGGHIWDWYLYPYSFFSYTLLTIFLINLKNFHRFKVPIMGLLVLITFLQFTVLKNIGFQENSYRSVIGKDIFRMSDNPDIDTLFLEPAGYIPYYAKIKTYDTVGLSSPEILKFRKQNNNKRWWLDFIETKRPTFVLDRSNIYDGHSHDGEYGLTVKETQWFKDNYKLVKKYNYQEYVKRYSGSLEGFYKHGNHAGFFLYKKIMK